MSAEPAPEIAHVSFKEAVELVGRKPDSAERNDLITLWGFGKKSWRWCNDIKIPLEDAMKIHQKIGEEMKVVDGKAKKPKK